MPSPNLRFKKYKTIRSPGGKIVRKVKKKKTSKHVCAICKATLHGMPHGKRAFEVRKLSKTQRRPENLLSSILCPRCRKLVYVNAIMLKYKIKKEDELDIRYKKYIRMIINKIE